MAKQESTDAKVLRLMDEVKKRRAEVEKLGKPSWLTSCSLTLPALGYSGDRRITIQVETDVVTLAAAIGLLNRFKADVEEVGDELEVELDTKWQNYPIDDWVTDLKLRIKITQIQAEKKKLARLEKTLEPLMSPEQQREMALASIEEELG
jgi:hypothetical protein